MDKGRQANGCDRIAGQETNEEEVVGGADANQRKRNKKNSNTMAENQETQKSKRDLFAERLKSRYPDKEFADDEAMYGQAGEDYDAYENELNGYREREGKLTDMFSRDPRSAQFIADMAKGADPWIAVIERLGVDGITDLMNNPSKKEAYEEANRAYAERVAKEKELEAEYERNQAESIKLREELDGQYGEETVDAALGVIDQMMKDAIMGKITRETFEMALKVVNHDADMTNARSEGEIAGRNAKIEERMRRQKSGDGMPVMGGANAGASGKNKKLSIFDYAEAAS